MVLYQIIKEQNIALSVSKEEHQIIIIHVAKSVQLGIMLQMYPLQLVYLVVKDIIKVAQVNHHVNHVVQVKYLMKVQLNVMILKY